MSPITAIAVSLIMPALFGAPLVFPKRWFVANSDEDRRTLIAYGKYDIEEAQ